MRYVSHGRRPAQAPHAGPRRRRPAARRGGHGLRGLLGQRVDPLPPAARRATSPQVGDVRADRDRGVGARRARAPADRHGAARAAAATRSSAAACSCSTTTSRSRSASRPRSSTPSTATARATRSSSSTRARASSRRSSARCPTRPRDYVVIPRGTTYRVALRRRPADVADVPHARRDRDAQPLPQPLRPAARARAVLPARLPSAARRCTHRDDGGEYELIVRARRGYQRFDARLPPVRRRRLGRLRLPLHVQHRRLRAEVRPPAPAADGPPDLPGPELRHLLVLPAQPRLGRARGRPPLPPLQPAVRGAHLLRRRRVRLARGRRRRAR